MIKPPKELGIFAWKRLILTISILLVLYGIMSWFTTPQEEDPQLAPRDGIITVIFPGATPKDMERLIAKPIEDELAQVDTIKTIITKLRTDFMFMQVKLKDAISTESETQNAWDKVQDALDRAEKKLPESAWKPDLNKEIYDQDAVLLSLSGSKDRLALLDQARILKDRLQSIPTVKKIDQVAAPGEQLSIVFHRGKLTRYGVSLENLVRQLRGGNALIPSGYVRVGDRKVSVLTNSFYRSSEELARFPVILKSGDTLPLSEVATISRTSSIPVTEIMRHNGVSAMALGVMPQHNVNLRKFGEQVRQVVKEFEATEGFKSSGIRIDEVSFQPHYVAERIYDICMDLLKAIFLVGGVLMLMLGIRVGSIVAFQVPVVTAVAFGIFSYNGGVLNQVSIAAFILAIGLLVDNVVVIVDGIQEKLDRGFNAIEAGERTRKEYLVPLAAGTLTTVAAFMPILMAKGTVADFTRAVGVVATIALLCSYVFCIFVTPIVASALLKKGKAKQWHFVEPLGFKMGQLVAKHPKTIVVTATCAVCVAVLGFGFVKKQFFPYADRDLVIIDMQLPEGTHYKATEKRALLVEEEVRKDPRVASVTTLIGRGVPPFYYNLPREPNSPHIAQFIVKTKTKKDAKDFKREKEVLLQKLVPFGTLMVKEISQGPVIRAPIEVRVFSHDPARLQEAAEKTLAAVRKSDGVWKVRSTLGVGMMSYRLDVNDSAAGNFGITRAEVSSIILANTRGIPVSTFRGASDPYSINLMSAKGEESRIEDIQSGYLATTRTDNLSVGTLTNEGLEFSPSVLEHRDRVPVVYVYGEIAPGSTENFATANVRKSLAKLGPIPGTEIKMGGTNAESSDANRAMVLALPVGLFLLLMSLMFEFNSFRRVAIILTTIPLCAVGSVPGLIITGSTFGFMTLLGFFTLAGTVIHNGIFLIDYIDHRMHDGVPLNKALTEGIQRRTRPIILTAVATIVELLPMTMSSSTLWPPFAWAIISGLTVSTLMTLLVIPSIFKLAFEKESRRVKVSPAVVTSLLAITVVVGVAMSSVARAATEPDAGPTAGAASEPAVMPTQEPASSPVVTVDQGPAAESVAEPVVASAAGSFEGPNREPAASHSSRRVSMQQILDRAKTSPDSAAAQSDAEKAHYEASAYWRNTYLPKVIGIGRYSHLDRDIGINNPLANVNATIPLPPALGGPVTLPIPRGPIMLDRDSYIARVQLGQPILNVSQMFYGSPAASTAAEAAKLKAARDVKDYQQRALGYYLQSLELRAKRSALENYVKNLQGRRNEIRRLYELGGVSEADLLKVKLGIDDANQGIREIREKEDLLATLLAQSVGEKGRLIPVDLPADLPAVRVERPSGVQGRQDIQALGKQIDAADLKAKAARASLLPNIEVFGGYTYFDQKLLTEKAWWDVGVLATWAIFDGTIWYAKSSAAVAEREALERRKYSAELAIQAQGDSAWRTLELKRQEYLERLEAVRDAKRTSDLDFKRLRQGKVTVNNVIDAEDMLKDRQEKADTSKVNWYQEWFKYQASLGGELTIPGKQQPEEAVKSGSGRKRVPAQD